MFSQSLNGFFQIFLIFFNFLQLLFEMNDFLILLLDFIGQFFFFLKAITIFLLFFQFAIEFQLSIQLTDLPILVLNLILKLIDLFTRKVTIFIFHLLNLFFQPTIFFTFTLQLLLQQLYSALICLLILS